MLLSIIAALSTNYVIGKNNQLPWHLPADLAHFKGLTMGKSMLMGRKTYESIGRPLPGRRNIVISRRLDFRAEGCEVAHSLDEALALVHREEEIMVIGGAQLFEEALLGADKLYLTWVHGEVEGDCHFPKVELAEWEEISREERAPDERNCYALSFVTLARTLKR
ncbi:MAG: dfrA3 [Gammaproteobacteria bacterium]|jgi:dihydrofolate reductase|nr:dfrA3 [Gammaproteobacteria bacterium]